MRKAFALFVVFIGLAVFAFAAEIHVALNRRDSNPGTSVAPLRTIQRAADLAGPGDVIHEIHVRRLFTGAEMAGIKFHGAIDVEIGGNHIYRTIRGLWLDWMAQGTRVTGNLFHDNRTEDLVVEVDHGPFLVDNTIVLSPNTLLTVSQGGAYVHNLMSGRLRMNPFDARQTPFHKAHSTELAGMHDNPYGDDRYINNLFVQRADLSPYDGAPLPVKMDGNV